MKASQSNSLQNFATHVRFDPLPTTLEFRGNVGGSFTAMRTKILSRFLDLRNRVLCLRNTILGIRFFEFVQFVLGNEQEQRGLARLQRDFLAEYTAYCAPRGKLIRSTGTQIGTLDQHVHFTPNPLFCRHFCRQLRFWRCLQICRQICRQIFAESESTEGDVAQREQTLR